MPTMLERDGQLTHVVIFAWRKGWQTPEMIEADIKAGVKQKKYPSWMKDDLSSIQIEQKISQLRQSHVLRDGPNFNKLGKRPNFSRETLAL